MHSIRKRAIVLALTICAFTVAGVTAALAATGSFTADEPAPPTPTIAKQIAPELSAQYALLRQPPSKADSLPAFPGREGMPPEYGENVALARRVGDGAYFAVPGNDSLCLFTEAGGGACSATPSEPMIMTNGTCAAWRAGNFELIALFPDGTDTATISYEDGSKPLEIPIRLNGINTQIPITKGNQTISWNAADGPHSTALAVVGGRMYCGE